LIAMPRVAQVTVAALLAALLLAGCGNKGPLVLPGQQEPKHKKSQPKPAEQKPPEQTPADQKSSDPNATQGSGTQDAQH
jgi:predicted small lipoprotein YifL